MAQLEEEKRKLFQFHKVRLKEIRRARQEAGLSWFQFHKVRLKVAIGGLLVRTFDSFNSIRYD